MKLALANAEQKIERDRLGHEAWGSPLSMSQFLERERILRGTPWARAYMKTWLLIDERHGGIVASCETFQMRSCFSLPEKGRLDGHTYGLASVFVEPRFRGKGHASQLIELVHGELEKADPKLQAFILYSEAGAPMYERLGYVLRPSYERVLTAKPLAATTGLVARVESRAQLIARAGELAVWPSLKFAIAPTLEQLRWYYAREEAYAGLLAREVPEHAGATYGESLICWVVDYRKDALVVLLLDASDPREAETLLQKAVDTARALRLKEVRVWETEAFSNWDAISLPSERRLRADDSLAMIRPCHPRLEPSYWTVISRATWV